MGAVAAARSNARRSPRQHTRLVWRAQRSSLVLPARSITTCPCPCRGSMCSRAAGWRWRSTIDRSSMARPATESCSRSSGWIYPTRPSKTMMAGSTGWSTTCSTRSVASLTTSCFGDRCTPRPTMPRQSRRTVRKPSFASPFVTNANRRREDRASGPPSCVHGTDRVRRGPSVRSGRNCRRLPTPPHDLQHAADSDARDAVPRRTDARLVD